MLTPFRESGEVDFHAFERNIGRWNETRLSGYVILGSNSETPFLSEAEKLELVRITTQNARKGMTIIAGTGLESARETIRLTNTLAGLGVHAALVLTPFYYSDQMTDQALIGYFVDVAAHADIPILLYNVPKFTHVNLSVSAVRQLSRHRNIVGMKDSAGDVKQLKSFFDVAPAGWNLIGGTASVLYESFQMGIRSSISALANVLPEECAEVQSLFDRGDVNRSKEQQSRLLPVNKAVTSTYGVAGLKFAASLTGFEGGFVRSPLLPLGPGGQEEIRKIMTEARFLDSATRAASPRNA